MKVPQSLEKLASGLHQDAYLCATEGLAAYCLDFLTVQERLELKPFLQKALASLTSAELKGILQRTSTDLAFSSKSARSFLQEVLGELERN